MLKPVKSLNYEKKDGLASIDPLRERYLDELIQPQELYLEMLVRQGDIWSIQMGEQSVGYLILSGDNTLLEYFLKDLPAQQSNGIFSELINRFEIGKILCKSFDTRLLSLCSDRQCSITSKGVLFRTYRPFDLVKLDSTIRIRMGEPDDKAILWELNEDVWETEAEVTEFITNKYVFIYETDSRMIGFGIFSPVIPGRPDHDIGMLVAPPFRRQGYGTRIIQHLEGHCRANNWRPICGCDIRNTPSWYCLEKAGFKAEHRLLLIELI